MTSMTSGSRPARAAWRGGLLCAITGVVVFQFFGNAAHGYTKTDSMFWWWISQWLDPAAETEHGWLILGLSGWLLGRNLQDGRSLLAGDRSDNRLQAGSYISAAAAMLTGLVLHAVGFAVQQTRVSIVGFLFFTWGVLRLAGGRRWGAAAAFPLGFMAFAIPLNAFDSIGFWLRMWVIEASAGLAHATGIGVLQSGTQLVAPDGRYNYDVAAACSGVRSLTALAALSLLVGYLNFRSWRRRGVALLLCFPLVYLGNVARISSIVFAAQLGGQAWGERAHTVMGYGIFAIVLGGVLGAVSLMARWWPEPVASPAAKPERADPDGCHRLNDKHPEGSPRGKIDCHLIDDKRSWGVVAAIVALAVGEMAFLHHLAMLPSRGAAGVRLTADEKNPVELPGFLGIEWTGRPVPVTPIEREILPADTGFSRRIYFNHRDPSKQVFLSIVLSGRDRTSIHRPELCLVGQGWTITGRGDHRFDYPARTDAGFSATVLRVQREVPGPATAGKPRGPVVVPQLTAFWFVSGDGVVASNWQRIVRDAWNRLVHARADRWAYVLMQTDATDGEAAALARMQAVLREALPAFQRPLAGG